MRRSALVWIVSLVCAMLFSASAARAGGDDMEPPAASSDLERMKALAGRWEGQDPETQQPMVVEYRVTAGGTAVSETLKPGSDHEMITMYHDKGGALAMTHYCTLGNQPEMTLIDAGDDRLSFRLAEGSDIDVAKESHMHALTITWAGDDAITHEWAYYEDGHEQAVHAFQLRRL